MHGRRLANVLNSWRVTEIRGLVPMVKIAVFHGHSTEERMTKKLLTFDIFIAKKYFLLRLYFPTLLSYSKSHAERLEAVQRRALNIIYSYIYFNPYITTLALLAGIPTLQARRLDFTKLFFFRKVCQPVNCLHQLLPPRRYPAVTSRLCKPTVYPRPNLDPY